jgi:hypothetical protein
VANIKQLFAIRILIWFAALAPAGMYLSILLAVLEIGPHIVGGEHVTRSEWLPIAAPLVAVIGILMALIGFGFATKKLWSRHVVIAMFSLIIVYASILGTLNVIHQAIMWRAIINASVFGAASVWYFILNQISPLIFASTRADDLTTCGAVATNYLVEK